MEQVISAAYQQSRNPSQVYQITRVDRKVPIFFVYSLLLRFGFVHVAMVLQCRVGRACHLDGEAPA